MYTTTMKELPRRLSLSQRCRNPTRGWRCIAVAVAYAIPGALCGMMAATFLGAPAAFLAAGIVTGMAIGFVIESH